MKHVWQVFKFEYLGCVKSKSFIISTIFLLAAIVLVTFVPAIVMGIIQSESSTSKDGEKPVIAVVNNAYEKNDELKEAFTAAFAGNEIKFVSDDENTLKNKINSDKYSFAVKLADPLNFVYYSKNNSMIDENGKLLSDLLTTVYRMDSFEKQGIDREKSAEILGAQMSYTTVATSVDQMQHFWSTYILLIILFSAIIMYGQMVSQSVVSEKNTRAMEMLITCAKPSHLMFGKIFGSGFAGITQLVIILSASLISVNTVGTSTVGEEIAQFINFPISTVLYAVLFFILGYFIYSFLLGALSSLASRSEDLNTLISPVMLTLTAAYSIVLVSANTGSLDSPLMIACSYFPLTAPVAMFVRISMSNVSFVEIIISVVLQLVTIWLLGMLASAIYRIGVLMYGKPPKFGELIKLLKEQRKSTLSRKTKTEKH